MGGVGSVVARKSFVLILIAINEKRNGFEIVGVSACVDPKNFDEEKGRYWARKEAFEQIWKLEGYALAKELRGVTP